LLVDATVSGNRKEVLPMYYVGIDIAKLNHFASVLSADGEVLVKPFKSYQPPFQMGV
jgi:hypothetical protein